MSTLYDLLLHKLNNNIDHIIARMPVEMRSTLEPQLIAEKDRLVVNCNTFFNEYLTNAPRLIFFQRLREYLALVLDNLFVHNRESLTAISPESTLIVKAEIIARYDLVFSEIANIFREAANGYFAVGDFKRRLNIKLTNSCFLTQELIESYCPIDRENGVVTMARLHNIITEVNRLIYELDLEMLYQQALINAPLFLDRLKNTAIAHGCKYADRYSEYLSLDPIGQPFVFQEDLFEASRLFVEYNEHINYWVSLSDLDAELGQKYYAEANSLTAAAPRMLI